MKITGCETLHCGAGWRNFSFLKLLTDEGLSGIAEYNESYAVSYTHLTLPTIYSV